MVAERSKLEEENERLREEVKALIRVEARLHGIQISLDQQLKISKKLHELSVATGTRNDVRDIATEAVKFALYELGYQRSAILSDTAKKGEFTLLAADGWYDDPNPAEAVRLPAAHALVRGVFDNKEVVHTSDAPAAADIADVARALDLVELKALPLLGADGDALGIMLVGNSEDGVEYAVGVNDEQSATGLANLSSLVATSLTRALSYAALLQERSLLDEKVKERTQELAAALKSLTELDNAKTQFFANVSHELRTPLTLSIGPLEELLKHGGEVPDETRSRHLSVIFNNQLRLLKLINNLLDFAKIDAGKMTAQFEELDLKNVLSFYLGTLEAAAAVRGIALSFDAPEEPVMVFLDREKFEKIAMNLLSNAFKFTPNGGRLSIAVRALADRVEFDVADTGVGIPEQALPNLFKRFMQVDSSEKRRYEGTGIGLALVKEYVTIHGGSIAVKSALQAGTTFTVTLPRGSDHIRPENIVRRDDDAEEVRRPASYHQAEFRAEDPTDPETSVSQEGLPLPPDDAPPDDAPVAHVEDEAAPATVLVVDDVADMRRFITGILKRSYRVFTAKDGVEGLEAAKRLRPKLIVSDVMMPRMTGFELCNAIKQDPALSRTPIVLLSAREDMTHKLRGLEHGADDYMAKPFNADELMSRVHNLLRLRSQEEALRRAQVQVVEAQRKALEAEIALASRVQMSILPRVADWQSPFCRLSGFLMSASACSGDFWLYQRLEDGRIAVILADVVGHGTASALVTQLAYGVLHTTLRAKERLEPSVLLSDLNGVFLERDATIGMTALAAIVDEDKREIGLSIAGHPPVLYQRGDEAVTCLAHSSAMLGRDANAEFSTVTMPIGVRTRFLMYSDGLVEAEGKNQRPLGLRRLANWFQGASRAPASCASELRRRLLEYVGGEELQDDVSAVIIDLGDAP